MPQAGVRVQHYVIDRLIQRVQATGIVDGRPRSDMPLKTTPRDDMVLA